ncbi:MAG: hypothetical protein RR387_02215, partial [Clostridiales bacterium]
RRNNCPGKAKARKKTKIIEKRQNIFLAFAGFILYTLFARPVLALFPVWGGWSCEKSTVEKEVKIFEKNSIWRDLFIVRGNRFIGGC